MYTVIDMKLFCRILFVMLFFPLAASAADTYLKLMQTGTAKQIKRAFLFDADAPFHTIGKERNNLLITAIIYDRSEDVIRLLLKADIGADQKNREKRTAVSYACEYCTGKSRFDLILASGGASPKKIRSRLMSRDKSGRYAASYAEKNSESEIRNSVASYLTQSDIALIEQTTEGGVPLLAAAVNAYRPTGESSKAVKRKTEKTKKREVKQTENDDLSPDAETTVADSETDKNAAESSDEKKIEESGNNIPANEKTLEESEKNIPVNENAAEKTLEESENNIPANENAEEKLSEKKESGDEEKNAQKEADESEAVPLPPSSAPSSAVRPAASYGKMFLYDYADTSFDTEEEIGPSENELIIKNVNIHDENGVTPLMFAIKCASIDLTRTLLKNGADVNACDKEGWTPLMYAVRTQNDKRFAAVLIDAGASVRAKNAFGISSLLIAAEYSQNPDIVSLLLASYSATENDVAKAFIHAITSSNVPLQVQCEKIRRFIAKGVPLNVFYEGKTPLMYAASSASSTAVIAVLLESGALPFARTAEGLRAFDFAKKNQALEKDAVYRSLNTDN